MFDLHLHNKLQCKIFHFRYTFLLPRVACWCAHDSFWKIWLLHTTYKITRHSQMILKSIRFLIPKRRYSSFSCIYRLFADICRIGYIRLYSHNHRTNRNRWINVSCDASGQIPNSFLRWNSGPLLLLSEHEVPSPYATSWRKHYPVAT